MSVEIAHDALSKEWEEDWKSTNYCDNYCDRKVSCSECTEVCYLGK